MKAKYLIIYCGLAIAFAGVSVWVFLSDGKAAKAVRAKYRLGGLMLTVWTMLNISSCNIINPGMTCYDPMPPSCIVGSRSLKPGSVLKINLGVYNTGDYEEYAAEIYYMKDREKITIQKDILTLNADAIYEMTIAPTDYSGGATLQVFGIGKESEQPLTNPETVYLNVDEEK